MVSFLPPKSLSFIKAALGETYSTLLMREISALVLAHAEGEVTNVKLREVVQIESSEATTLLKSLVDRDLLDAHGSNRSRIYTLGAYFTKDTSEFENTLEVPEKDTSEFGNEKTFAVLQEKIRQGTIKPNEIIMFIKLTCKTKEKSAYELGKELLLTPMYLKRKYLQKLVEDGHLSVTRGARGLHLYQTI